MCLVLCLYIYVFNFFVLNDVFVFLDICVSVTFSLCLCLIYIVFYVRCFFPDIPAHHLEDSCCTSSRLVFFIVVLSFVVLLFLAYHIVIQFSYVFYYESRENGSGKTRISLLQNSNLKSREISHCG